MTRLQRYIAATVVVCAALFSSYVYAATRNAGTGGPVTPPIADGASVACAWCGTAASAGPATSGEAVLASGVQRIEVDTSSGRWDPSEIRLAAGVPAEITFAEGQGCLAQVVFPELGLDADLTHGGATVSVPALAPGEYTFSCGMRMVFGKLVVR